MQFPMDAAEGDILHGHVNGRLKNGATVIPGGIAGGAFYSPGYGSGSYADFGTVGCLHDPDSCTSGITFSFWVKISELPGSSLMFILHSGGCYSGAAGFCLDLVNDFVVFVSRHNAGGCNALTSSLALFKWHFLTVSYNNCSISFYSNGCRLPLTSAKTWDRRPAITLSYAFTIGGVDGDTSRSLQMAIDHMLVWNTELSPEDIWELYLLGGFL